MGAFKGRKGTYRRKEVFKRISNNFIMLAATVLLSSCTLIAPVGPSTPTDGNDNSGGTDTISSEKDIFSFSILDVDGNIDGSNILLTLPFETDLTALTPTITISPKASVTPASGTAQDFTAPIAYTVTAEDLSTKIYYVVVSKETLTCDEIKAAFTHAIASSNCSDASVYLDAYIDDKCSVGDYMSFITMMLQFKDGLACEVNCAQREALAYAYLAIGDNAKALTEINIIISSGLCPAQCAALVTYCKQKPTDYCIEGGGPAMPMCTP